MKIIYGKQLNNIELQTVNEIALACGITFDTARLLFYRNQNTVEKAKRFLNPSKLGFHNPDLLSGMKKAVQEIYQAKLLSQNVLVFGDYDADGICASTILYNCLKDYGIENVRAFVPERIDGYGISLSTIEKLESEEHIDLLITVDCGISDSDKIEQLMAKGISVIVTDHHEPPEQLPKCTCVNPKIPNQDYPFDGLCGAGVAYKLGYALIGEKANDYLDFVALATVADSMDLIDENRDIVAEGLKIFNNANKVRPCMKYLIGDSNKTILAQTLAYSIAPRINAGGRMGDADCALKLFTSKDDNLSFDLAVKLNQYNIQRQAKCDEIYQSAKAKIQKYSLNKKNVILIKDKNWQTGFVGIVAAKLVEEFARPVIVFAGQEDYLKGSARSVDGINIYEAICNTKEHLLGFGGHSQAAGVSVSFENFSNFDKAINNYIKTHYESVDVTPKTYVDWKVDKAFSPIFLHELNKLEPFGTGNRNPMFSIDAGKIKAQPIKEGSPHYSFKTDIIDMLDFNGESDATILNLPINKKIVFDINISTYMDKEYVRGHVKTVCPDYSDLSQLSLHAINIQLDNLLKPEGEYKTIKKDTLQLRNNKNTLYILSDEENLKNYPQLKDLPKTFNSAKNKNFSSEIVFAPSIIPSGYDRVVYLDKPMQVLKSFDDTLVVTDLCGYKFIEKLSVDRDDFAKMFNQLKTLDNEKLEDIVDFVVEHANSIPKEQFIFALKTFIELGIFSIKNKRLIYDEKIRNALTNSKLYSKIILLKENYV